MNSVGELGLIGAAPGPLVTEFKLRDDLFVADLDLASERRIGHDDIESAESDALPVSLAPSLRQLQ